MRFPQHDGKVTSKQG